jgi:hypothetical protein
LCCARPPGRQERHARDRSRGARSDGRTIDCKTSAGNGRTREGSATMSEHVAPLPRATFRAGHTRWEYLKSVSDGCTRDHIGCRVLHAVDGALGQSAAPAARRSRVPRDAPRIVAAAPTASGYSRTIDSTRFRLCRTTRRALAMPSHSPSLGRRTNAAARPPSGRGVASGGAIALPAAAAERPVMRCLRRASTAGCGLFRTRSRKPLPPLASHHLQMRSRLARP